MSEAKEQQQEEYEALISIYEGDEAFKAMNSTTYQYKYGQNDDIKSFLLEISWGDNYPFDPPAINLDLFYNRNLPTKVKNDIKAILLEEAQQWLGCAMTYTLFECLKERIEELLANVTEVQASAVEATAEALQDVDIGGDPAKAKPEKKEQMTKAQKRRMWDKSDHSGNRARGWDWIDVIKHLSQTGGKGQHVDETITAST